MQGTEGRADGRSQVIAKWGGCSQAWGSSRTQGRGEEDSPEVQLDAGSASLQLCLPSPTATQKSPCSCHGAHPYPSQDCCELHNPHPTPTSAGKHPTLQGGGGHQSPQAPVRRKVEKGKGTVGAGAVRCCDDTGWGAGPGRGCWGVVGRGRWRLRKLQYYQHQEGRLGGTEGLPLRTVGARRVGVPASGGPGGSDQWDHGQAAACGLKCHQALRAILQDPPGCTARPQSSSRTP